MLWSIVRFWASTLLLDYVAYGGIRYNTNKHDFYRLLNNRELAKEHQSPLHKRVEGNMSKVSR
jgi:hypothetical protein